MKVQFETVIRRTRRSRGPQLVLQSAQSLGQSQAVVKEQRLVRPLVQAPARGPFTFKVEMIFNCKRARR
jgi:hypothetical protein